MYYSEAVGKIEMYLLCQKYHMSGCVQYEPTNEMMVELYGEERKIDNFMPVLEKYFNRKPWMGNQIMVLVILELDRNIMQVLLEGKWKHRKNIIDIF